MNFNNVVFIFLLLPLVSYGNEVEARIKELKEAQIAKSQEILEITGVVNERAAVWHRAKEELVRCWKPRKEDLLDSFMDEFTGALYSGGDLDVLIEKYSFHRGHMHLARAAAALFLHETAIRRCKALVNELLAISREFNAALDCLQE